MNYTAEELDQLIETFKPIIVKALKTDKEFKESVRGVTGPPGKQGEMGKQGPEGRPGPEGKEGKIGPMGGPGKQGNDGPRGKDGPMGPPGQQGQPGQNGNHGRDGLAGALYACRAFNKEAITINPNEWTTVYFTDDSFDQGPFHNVGDQYLNVVLPGMFRISSTVTGASKIRIIHIAENGRETSIVESKSDSCDTLYRGSRYEKFRVDVFCDATLGIMPGSAIFLIQKVDRSG